MRRNRPDRRQRERGFTLIEAVVALLILALGLTAVMRLVSTGLDATQAANRLSIETLLARSELARFAVEQPIEPGEQAGELAGGYRWRRIVRPLAEMPGLVLLEVALTVWREGRDAGHSVTTLRLIPALAGGRAA